MQTIAEVVGSSQENVQQALPKQAPPVARIRDLRGITAKAKNALHSLNSRQPNIFPGMKTLAADMGVSLSTAHRALRELEQAGYVRVTPRIGQTNLYSITVAGATSRPRIHALPPVSVTPPPCQPDTPPPVSVTPEVSKEVSNISIKRERESTRTLSPGNQSSKETITCPQCEHSWTANFGTICHTCKMEVSTIKRNIEERNSRHEAFLAELRKEQDAKTKQLEFYRQKLDAQRKEAETCTQEQKAEQKEKSPVDAEAEEKKEADHQAIRKRMRDATGQPYDAELLKYYPVKAL